MSDITQDSDVEILHESVNKVREWKAPSPESNQINNHNNLVNVFHFRQNIISKKNNLAALDQFRHNISNLY